MHLKESVAVYCSGKHSKHLHNNVHFQRLAHALTIKDLDDLLADEVPDFIIIDDSLLK